MTEWATIDMLADLIGIPQDARMIDCLTWGDAWAKSKRPDLVALEDAATPPGSWACPTTVQYAVLAYSALLYRERVTPQGIAGYESEGGGFTDSTAYYRCLDMVGYKKPVAR